MNDRQQLILLLEEFEVVWEVDHYDPNSITIIAKAGPKNNGYDGFTTTFRFRDDGSFKEIDIYE